MFQGLKNTGLTINLKKCEFFRPSPKFLGFFVDQEGLRTDLDKAENKTEIIRLMDLFSWYRRYLKNISSISSIINILLHGRKTGQPVVWTKEPENLFNLY